MQIMESEQISQLPPTTLNKIDAPTSIKLVKSFSEDAIDIHASDGGSTSPSIQRNKSNNYLMVDSNKKSFHTMSHSENDLDIDTDYELTELTEDEEDDNYDNKQRRGRAYTSGSELPSNKSQMVHRANSDILFRESPVKSRYGRRKKKKKLQNLDGLSRDDLKYELLKEKKKRRGDRDKFKRESTALRNKFTNIADDYEEQLMSNETELKQEYEVKLIEAEMQRQQLEQEVQRLKQLLLTNNNPHSIQSTTTDDTISPNNAVTGPISAPSIASTTPRPVPITITSPSNHIYTQQAYNNHNNNNINAMMGTPASTTSSLPYTQPITTTNGSSSTNELNSSTPNNGQFSVISSTQTGTPIAAPMMVNPFSLTSMELPTPLEKKDVTDEVCQCYYLSE